MTTILKSIRKEILSWPHVTFEAHRYGDIEFRMRYNYLKPKTNLVAAAI